MQNWFWALTIGAIGLTGCGGALQDSKKPEISDSLKQYIADELEALAPVTLSYDLSALPESYRKMIPHLLEVASYMDDLFWDQTLSIPRDEFLKDLPDENMRKLAMIHYGPYNRLDGEKSFVPGFDLKSPGANFYPNDMDTAEFTAAGLPDKTGHYTLLRRDSEGKLMVIPYHKAYAAKLKKASEALLKAANLCEDAAFKTYLEKLANAFVTDQYEASDLAWMDSKTSLIDFVAGPIETYEDGLYGYKAGYEAYVLIKDTAWSSKLARFAAYLPELQQNLPVPAAYKKEMPGSESQLNAYDVIYYAGHANAGGKTIAINLPNSETIQLQKGTKRLQLKNVMRAKFDLILKPIAQKLMVTDQQQFINFDAFFATVMFHEVAHGLGIKNTIDGKQPVSKALKSYASAIEEGKADILGLYMITQLHAKGLMELDMEAYYTTFVAGIFRSVRFGASSDHGKANMVRFNFFMEQGAITREADGKYRVNFEKCAEAVTALSQLILKIQGDGNEQAAAKLMEEKGKILSELQSDLDGLKAAKIPVDIRFEQGKSVLQIQ